MDEQMVSTFMEITACESQAYAVQHLGSCRWKLDEAIDLYFNSGGSGILPEEEEMEDDDSGVRAPIPSRVEALYEDDAFYYDNHAASYVGFGEEPYPAPPASYIGFGEEPYPAPPPAFHAQATGEETGWGVAADFSKIAATGWGEPEQLSKIAATGWGEPEPGDGGHVGAEDFDGGGESHGDAKQEDNNSRRRSSKDDTDQEEDDDDDDMTYSDNEVDDYGFLMDEDDSSYYASIQEDGTEDAGEQPRPAPPPPSRQQNSALDALFKPPRDLIFTGSFHDSKVRAATDDRFLLVNLQAVDFVSMLYNRDLWSVEQVKNAVKKSFVLFLAQKNSALEQGSKVCSFYRLEEDELPAMLILDPITGQLLNKWSGPMTPDEFMQYVDAYTKEKPSTMTMPKFVKRTPAPALANGEQPASSSASAAAAVVEQEPAAPATTEAGEQEPEILPENAAPAGASCGEQEPVPAPEAEPPAEMIVDDDDEPMEGEKMYKLRIRFPDGTMVAKEFGCKRRVASLFAFCSSAVRGGGEAAAEEQKAFRVMRFAGRGFEEVQSDDSSATFEDLALNCATVSVVFAK